MSVNFSEWKRLLLESAGSVGPQVRKLGDHVLEVFWRDGCEPTMAAMLDYSQAGLCREIGIRVSDYATNRATVRLGSR